MLFGAFLQISGPVANEWVCAVRARQTRCPKCFLVMTRPAMPTRSQRMGKGKPLSIFEIVAAQEVENNNLNELAEMH